MNNDQMIKKAYGILSGLGLKLESSSDGKYKILNQRGKVLAGGSLETVYYAALYVANDAKENPEKYASMNEPVKENELIQAGRDLAKRLRGKE